MVQEALKPVQISSQNGVVTFTDAILSTNLKLDFVNNIAGISRFKLVTTTHDVSVTGDQAITGAGFAPKAAIVLAVVANTTGNMSVGITDGTGYDSILATATAGQYTHSAGAALINMVTTGVQAYASLKSMDADGATITWAKTGLPTGTAQILILFLA